MAYCAYCGSWVAQVSHVACTSCGRPTNGAPPPVAPAGGTNAGIIIGVVVGVLVLFGIIGILAAIAIPNLLTATQRSKQKRTMADMRSIAVAVETYRVDNGAFPKAESASGLGSFLVPKYMTNVPAMDAWGNELRYRCNDEACSEYAITSSGADRIFEHVTAAEYEEGATSNFDDDIVFANGKFIRSPQGPSGGN